MTHADWEGKKVLVLGMGDTGVSCVRWLAPRGARVRVADSREAPAGLAEIRSRYPQVDVLPGRFDEALLEGMDTVVASPGIALREPLLVAAKARGLPVVGDVEIFAREIRRGTQARVIAITGTNGKSTVTALAGEMGRAAGLRTVVAGNIGLPVLDALEAEPDAQLYVIELSSYQLETTSSLALDAATMLNLTQDHMDRYDSMAAYARAKERIFLHAERRIVNRDDGWSRSMADPSSFSFGLSEPKNDREWGLDASRARILHGDKEIIDLGDMALTGLHNAANAMAAHALGTALELPPWALTQGLREFAGLPHRVELVARAKGVSFFDDSKGTNVGASVAALEGFRERVVLIAGGDGKGQDFSPLAPAVKAHARAVVLIGRDAPGLAAALVGADVPMANAMSMQEAVEASYALAHSGDAVLLSPACASFDMFRNYAHRGDVFAEAARAIAEREGP
ncbi:MAG TPA: UDP-N-acetylmuramoyl-L-alanine--D-glutamate ligase [Usitatibacter sp.]|nr:UDP-N-acetylmuramoyl-L-alanine--D-glutamate ligase [Usitatibacter sp.]